MEASHCSLAGNQIIGTFLVSLAIHFGLALYLKMCFYKFVRIPGVQT